MVTVHKKWPSERQIPRDDAYSRLQVAMSEHRSVQVSNADTWKGVCLLI